MSTLPKTSDLVDRLKSGDARATSRLLEDHLDGVWEFVHYRVGGDRAAAEDVVQDTFVVALEKIGGFDGRSTLHTWLCGIAKNRIRELRRHRRPMALADALESATPEIDAILAEIERTPLPEWVLERRETSELVGATLSNLPPDYRRALLDKYVEGLTTDELGQRTGRGIKATESLLQRSRAAFARVFQLLAKRRGGVS